MKRVMALWLIAGILALPAAAGATASAGKPTAPMIIESIDNPEGQNGGRLYAAFTDGVLLLEYDETLTGTALLTFTFAKDNNTQLLGGSSVAFARDMNPDDLLDPAQEGIELGNTQTLAIQIDPHIKALNLLLETENSYYEAKRIPVLWKPVTVGPPIDAQIWPGDEIAIGTGQEIELDIRPIGEYSDKRVSLKAATYENYVVVMDSSLRGVKAGKQVVAVYNGAGQVIRSIEVTVQDQPVNYPRPTQAPVAAYRVLAPTIDAFARPDETLVRMGTIRQGQIVSVTSTVGEWLELQNGAWVRAENLAAL